MKSTDSTRTDSKNIKTSNLSIRHGLILQIPTTPVVWGLVIDALIEGVKTFFFSFGLHWTETQYTMSYKPTSREDERFWHAAIAKPFEFKDIVVNGAVVTEVRHLGPTFTELTSSYTTVKKWRFNCSGVFRGISKI